MTTTRIGSVSRVELDDYLLTEYVENIADAGAFSNIKVKEGYVDEIFCNKEQISCTIFFS
ncbi:hypothetical protein Avbf_06212 [Armadillidium vulgare]|nr:hypothetical protein Avbf_06212 [Armadillidium vulgare]